MSIAWDEERMSTGLADIDEQHQELIRRYNDLLDAIAQDRGRDLVDRVLGFLADYTVTHFACEEARMLEHRCPAARRNKAAHDELRADLARIRARVQADGTDSVDVVHLQQALGNWIRNHICSIDVRLRECVRAEAARAS